MNIQSENTGSQDEAQSEENEVGMDFSGRGHKSNAVSRFMMFLRVLGMWHLLLGCYVWLYLLGVIYMSTSFYEQPLPVQITILFAATVSFVAGLGLWLLAPWGVTLWLFLTIVLASSATFLGNPIISLSIFLFFNVLLVGIYVALRRRYETFIEHFGYNHGI